MTSGWDALDAFQVSNRNLPKIADAIDLAALQMVRYAPLERSAVAERHFELLGGDLIPRFQSPRLRLLLRYWLSLVRQGIPDARLVEPTAIAELLPNMMVVAITDPPLRVFYRHVGAEVARFTGLEFTGHYLHELAMDAFSLQMVENSYREVLKSGRPGAGIEPFIRDGECLLRTEFLICPLATAEPEAQCLVIEDYFLAPGIEVADLVPARWVSTDPTP